MNYPLRKTRVLIKKTMTEKIAITTTTFGQMDHCPLDLLEESGIQYVRNTSGRALKGNELVTLLDGCCGVIAGTEKYDKESLNQLQNLKVISRLGVGIDAIDLGEVKGRGIQLFTTPDGPTKAVAELAIGLMLSLLRKIPFLNEEVHNQKWQKSFGALFFGKRIGIIGLGQIGKEVARLSKALGGIIQYYDPYIDDFDYPDYESLELEELLKQSDLVTVHTNYSKENHHLLNQKKINFMQEHAYLINCSRGGIVDEEALYDALSNGQLAGAALDVFEEEPYQGPLKDLNNVILTPHIGSYAKEARIKMEIDAVNNLIKGLKNTN